MLALERRKKIVKTLNEDGAVSVSKLSIELGVTEETIRRDLEKLEKQEVLIRSHGGAVPIDENIYEVSIERRRSINVDAKIKLSQEAVKHIKPGDIVFLDASTTTFYMAKEIKNMKNVTVVTNSIRVITELAGHKDIKTIAIGGVVSNNQSFIGGIAEDSIKNGFYATKMFFSSKGVLSDVGILESNEQECAVKKQMLEHAREKYYLCDKTKLGRVGFIKLADFLDIDCFITEATPEVSLLDLFKEINVKVIKI